MDNSPIDSNPWLSGFSDANSSINIHQRSNKNLTRVQLYYRLEIKQTYPRLNNEGEQVTLFPIMSKVARYLGSNVLSRSRITGEKQFYCFILMREAHNKISLNKINEYLTHIPLFSSKYLDYKAWAYVLELQQSNPRTTSYLEEAINIREDLNSTRTTYNWNHLKNFT